VDFEYTIYDTEKCIHDTEDKIRDFVSAVLNRKYGSAWESDPTIGWNTNKREELENRRAKKKNFLYKIYQCDLLIIVIFSI